MASSSYDSHILGAFVTIEAAVTAKDTVRALLDRLPDDCCSRGWAGRAGSENGRSVNRGTPSNASYRPAADRITLDGEDY
jgi:hypothetical protein